MEYITFKLLNSKKSGFYSIEKNFKNHFINEYKEINEYNKDFDGISFKEKLYRYFKKDTQIKKCVCGEDLKLYSIERGYSKYCSVKCSNVGNVSKIKDIKFNKYGDPNYNNIEKFKKSIALRSNEDIEETNKKREKTKNRKYGNPYFLNIQKAKETSRTNKINAINKEIAEFNVTVEDIIDESSFLIKCSKCNKSSRILNSRFNIRRRNKIDPCIICNNYNTGTSRDENEVSNFIESLGIINIKNDRKLLNGMEIDILIESKKIAIEYNGLYWHSELNTPNNYHLRKKTMCESMGINLIHIWEDDWRDKKEIVKSRIINILGITPKKIYARKCTIKAVNYTETKKFLNANHIQGFCSYKHSFGLYYEENLVAISTFGRRKINGAAETELLRFCSMVYTNVIGGFSKLFKHYTELEDCQSVITFADRSWSVKDNTYIQNGFNFISETKPGYWYIVEKTRKHRYNYRKSILVSEGFDPELTESQIMMDRGILRIYDCGHLKYRWTSCKYI